MPTGKKQRRRYSGWAPLSQFCIHSGDALHLPDDRNPRNYHTCIVISDTDAEPNDIVCVPIVTFDPDHPIEETCLLDPKNYPACRFLKHLSEVDYRFGHIRPAVGIAKLLRSGKAQRKERAPSEMLAAIRHGVEETDRLPEESRALLVQQNLISA